MPSREKLRAFVNHVRLLTPRNEAGEDGFDREYQSLIALQKEIKGSSDYPTNEGKLEHNRKKNRYKDILPFDFSRVALTPQVSADKKSILGSDYINASFLQDANGENSYIAAMGPLSSTVGDFWRMIWLYDVKIVVMLCKEVEMGKKKCARYWPEPQEGVVTHGEFNIRLVDQIRNSDELTNRTLEVEKDGTIKKVHQFHFMSWPDHGVPDSAQPIVDLIKLFRTHQPFTETHPPLVIHCSAGCGRTGTVCAVDYAWQLLASQVNDLDVSVLDIVTQFRHQRLSMVQTKDQYTLIYKAVLKLVKMYLGQPQAKGPPPPTPAKKDDLYENVEIGGGVAYGQKSSGLAPKKKDAPPIPATRRRVPDHPEELLITNVDNVTLEDAEEEAHLLQQITAATMGHAPQEDEGELEETADAIAPPIPHRTALSRQLESPTNRSQVSVSSDTDMYASVSQASNRSSRNSYRDEGPDEEDEDVEDGGDLAPPKLPARTRDSYIMTSSEPPAIPGLSSPTSSSPVGDDQSYATLRLTGPEHESTLSVSSSPRPVSSFMGASSPPTPDYVNSPNTSTTLPSSGRHGAPVSTGSNTAPAGPSSVKEGAKKTREAFKNLVQKKSRKPKNIPPPTITPPVPLTGSQASSPGGQPISSPQSQYQGLHSQPTSQYQNPNSGAVVKIFSDDMGFKNRVRRPKGPRAMPSHWRSF